MVFLGHELVMLVAQRLTLPIVRLGIIPKRSKLILIRLLFPIRIFCSSFGKATTPNGKHGAANIGLSSCITTKFNTNKPNKV